MLVEVLQEFQNDLEAGDAIRRIGVGGLSRARNQAP